MSRENNLTHVEIQACNRLLCFGTQHRNTKPNLVSFSTVRTINNSSLAEIKPQFTELEHILALHTAVSLCWYWPQSIKHGVLMGHLMGP